MAAYRQADRSDRLKAGMAVLAVHAGLAAIILSGLNVEIVARQVERMTTISVRDEVPPPPPEPVAPPRPDESSAPKDEAAPANIRSKPAPVVAPTPPIPLPIEQKIASADVRGPEGADRTAGASNRAGRGTGAGGQGDGFGGGGRGGDGAGDGRGFTPARRMSKIPDREYRRFVAASGMQRGSVGITVKVNTDGRPSHCRIVRSSGSQTVDSLMCQMTLQHVRFQPARDPQGRPVAQDISWFPDWSPR